MAKDLLHLLSSGTKKEERRRRTLSFARNQEEVTLAAFTKKRKDNVAQERIDGGKDGLARGREDEDCFFHKWRQKKR